MKQWALKSPDSAAASMKAGWNCRNQLKRLPPERKKDENSEIQQ
jgi:hypothetical protein